MIDFYSPGSRLAPLARILALQMDAALTVGEEKEASGLATVLVAWALIAMDRWPNVLAARGGVDSGSPVDPSQART